MAVTIEASGTGISGAALTVGTEHTLATIAGPGVYVYNVDLSVMLAGDVIELRVKKPVLSGGTANVPYYAMFTGVQPAVDAEKPSVPFVVDSAAGGCLATIKQTIGTGRTPVWSIQKIA